MSELTFVVTSMISKGPSRSLGRNTQVEAYTVDRGIKMMINVSIWALSC